MQRCTDGPLPAAAERRRARHAPLQDRSRQQGAKAADSDAAARSLQDSRGSGAASSSSGKGGTPPGSAGGTGAAAAPPPPRRRVKYISRREQERLLMVRAGCTLTMPAVAAWRLRSLLPTHDTQLAQPAASAAAPQQSTNYSEARVEALRAAQAEAAARLAEGVTPPVVGTSIFPPGARF